MARTSYLDIIRANEFDGDAYDFVCEFCQTYEDMGALLAELLGHFAGGDGHDDAACTLLAAMVRDYAGEVV